MKKQIILCQKNIEYTLKISKRARRMRLVIYSDGNFVVTAPRNMSENIIEQFIIKKSRWIFNKLEYFKNFPSQGFEQGTRKNYLEYKYSALIFVRRQAKLFNNHYCFKYNKINIKNQKTRWGSCSRKGNLNFNYKIVLLPEKLANYIVVHELCHLKEFNHSPRFWNLVAQLIPDYLEIKKELKKSGQNFIDKN